jgi:nucleoside-triphosphatase THEP1
MAGDDSQPKMKVGVIVRPPDGRQPASMEGFARILQGQGYLVRGLVQRNSAPPGECAADMTLVDLDSGREIPISQDLGSGSNGCRVDTQRLAEASALLRAAMEEETDLLVVNKFGKLEAQGEGLMDEILAAVSMGIPVLTSVETALIERWREFSGGLAEELSPGCGALMNWWEGVRPRGVGRVSRLLRPGQCPDENQPFQRIEPIPETS